MTYLNRMVDGVGEVLDRASRRLLLWRVLGGRIGLCEVGDNDLGVALGPEGSGLPKGLPVEDATLVHVEAFNASAPLIEKTSDAILTSLDIVQSVRNTVDVREEVLVVDLCKEAQRMYSGKS